MSIPRIHHFVSQVLIKKFLGPNQTLYTYSKSEGIKEEKYTRHHFAEKDLNSIISPKGEVDHKSVEDNLNRNFEANFNTHYNALLESLESNNYSKLTNSIAYLIRMGIIGDMRTPEHQTEEQSIILQSISTIYNFATEEVKKEIEGYDKQLPIVKNKILVDYGKLCDEIIDLMGETIYSVFKASKDHLFFLPDNSSVVFRSQLEPDTLHEGKLLKNPCRPISTIIFPINSKIIIVAQSAKICPQKSHGIHDLTEESTIAYNNLFIEHSRNQVICSNIDYLNEFIINHLIHR